MKFLIEGIKDQLPIRRLIRNLFKGHVLGLFHKRSHLRDNGEPKVGYNTKSTAQKSAQKMTEKWGVYVSNYKCIYCGKYHLGKNKDNKGEKS